MKVQAALTALLLTLSATASALPAEPNPLNVCYANGYYIGQAEANPNNRVSAFLSDTSTYARAFKPDNFGNSKECLEAVNKAEKLGRMKDRPITALNPEEQRIVNLAGDFQKQLYTRLATNLPGF